MQREGYQEQWREVGRGADSTRRVATEVDELFDSELAPVTAEGLAARRDALLRVTAAGSHLARVLDTLANEYQSSSVERTPDVYVALDQAAAAAEDLASCTRLAASALADDL